MISKEEYVLLKDSGYFWEWWPEATGIYEVDIKTIFNGA